jgi:DNA invertase Pin-like site-specific DNA recombinase
MLLDMLAAFARKDYSDLRRRQAQGIAKAKTEGKYVGRPEDAERNAAIVGMLAKHTPWSAIVAATGCSRSTLSRLAKRVPVPQP